jgi:hypothetical protein
LNSGGQLDNGLHAACKYQALKTRDKVLGIARTRCVPKGFAGGWVGVDIMLAGGGIEVKPVGNEICRETCGDTEPAKGYKGVVRCESVVQPYLIGLCYVEVGEEEAEPKVGAP